MMPISLQSVLNTELASHPHAICVKSQSNFMRVLFFLNRDQKRALEAVYAFARVLDDAVDEWEAPETQQVALDFWKTHFDNLYADSPKGLLMQELHWAIETFSIPLNPFYELMAGCAADISTHRYDTFLELESYCYAVASTIGLIALPIFGIKDLAAEAPSIALGKALQLTNILRDIYEDFLRGRIYIPREDFDQFAYKPEWLGQKLYTPAFIRLMSYQAEKAELFFKEATSFLDNQTSTVYLPPWVMGRTYHTLLQTLKRRRFEVFQKRVGLSGFHKTMVLLHIGGRYLLSKRS